MQRNTHCLGDGIHKKLGHRRQTALHICAICSGVADPVRHAVPHMCYRAELSRSTSKGVGKLWGAPKFERAEAKTFGWGSV